MKHNQKLDKAMHDIFSDYEYEKVRGAIPVYDLNITESELTAAYDRRYGMDSSDSKIREHSSEEKSALLLCQKLVGSIIDYPDKYVNRENEVKKELLCVKDLATMIDVSVRKIWRLNDNGAIPSPIHIGRSVKWKREEIEKWIEAKCPNRQIWNDVLKSE